MRSRLMTTLALALALAAAACGGGNGTATTVGEAAATSAPPEEATTAAPTTAAPTTAAPTTAAPDECAVDGLELVTPGQLTVATSDPAFPPWVLDDDPSLGSGFEAELVYELAADMGFTADQVTWVAVGFDEAIAPGPKDFDFNIQQYSITNRRDQVVDFSDPYYVTKQALVAFGDNPIAEATTIEELREFSLGAQIASTSLEYIETVIQPTTPASVFDTNADAKSALDAQQIDAIVFDLPTAYFITAVEMPDTTIVAQFGEAAENPDEFGLLFADGNTLVDCVNLALATLREDGTLAALEEEYLVVGSDIPVITP